MARKQEHATGPTSTQEYWSSARPAAVKCLPGASLMTYLWESCRYRVEGLRLKAGDRPIEYRIPCKYGEVYPVSESTWAWCGASTRIAAKVMRVLGGAAEGPFGGPPVLGDESVIWFKKGRVEEVLAAANARRRRRPNAVTNLPRKGRAS